MFLDPRFKLSYVSNQDTKINTAIDEIITKSLSILVPLREGNSSDQMPPGKIFF